MRGFIPNYCLCLGLRDCKKRSIRSYAKVLGTLATVSGAMIMTLVKGPVLEFLGRHGNKSNNQHASGASSQHTMKGSVMIIIARFGWGFFVILQAITLQTYPAGLSLTAWICLLGIVENTIIALIMERGNSSIWSLHWDTELVAVVYSGIVCTGLAYYIQGVVMKTRGPIFVTAFNPLCMVIVAVMESFILTEQFYFGRVIGAIVIVLGLYLVLWGKSRDNGSPTPSTREHISPTEVKADEGNANGEEIIPHDRNEETFFFGQYTLS